MTQVIDSEDMRALAIAAAKYYTFNSEGRFYHNWDHVCRVLESLQGVIDTSVHIAAIWHDAIYIPGSKINEEASADALEYEWKRLGIKADLSILRDISQLVRFTTVQNHLVKYRLNRNQNAAALMDADLRSLADPYIEFRKNQDNIIRENGGNPFVLEDNRKCAEFLSKFLTCREYIYHTDTYRELHETNARQNITRYMQETKA